MYILAAVSQLNCLMASGTWKMKVKPADLLRHLQGWLHCKWQKTPTAMHPPTPNHPSEVELAWTWGPSAGAPGSRDTNEL